MSEKHHKPTSVMIVEDEGIVALDLRRRLDDLGFAVVGHASDAEEALRGVRAEAPDVVLMDINLGDGPDGITVAEMLAKESDVPVVFLTAHSDPATLARAGGTAPFGYVLKPVRDRELQIAIEMALYKHQSEMQLKRVVRDLENALSQVKTLSGLLPICLHCKNIRGDRGYWVAVEEYLSTHADVAFSHGICEKCLALYYPDLRVGAVEPDAPKE
jgi:AmiR/NasT family two-component response regulator